MALWVMTQAIMILVITYLFTWPQRKTELACMHTDAHPLSSGGLGCLKAF